MEYSLLSLTAVAGAFTFILFIYCRLFWKPIIARRSSESARGRNSAAPKVAGAWPIIGHLHLLGGSKPPHITLGSMADKYGPIFTIKLGMHQVLVVSDSKIAKECFTTNDKVFATRPKSLAVELMGYNYALFGMAPYGTHWRQARKISTVELLSNSRIEMLAHIRVSEVRGSITDIYRRSRGSGIVKMEMKKWFGSVVLNIVMMMLVGKRYVFGEEEIQDKSRESIEKFVELLGVIVVADAIPFLRLLDLGGYEKAMKETAKEIDGVLSRWLLEQKRKKTLGHRAEGEDEEQQKFMDVILDILDGANMEDFSGFDADTVVKSTCLAILAGATDTTTVTLTWALSLLLNNPCALKKAKDELNMVVGRERMVEESDIKNLVYLQAIIKETLRLYPAVPLSVPHESVDDCVVSGYKITKGTRLLVNLSKIHRDPHTWPDPAAFRPERFMTSHKEVKVEGQHFELIPFGSGRRMCPGLALGLQILHFTLASFIHAFEVRKPSDEPIDMSESVGLTNMKATPLEVLLTPCLSPNSYK